MLELRIHGQPDLAGLIEDANFLWIRACEHDGIPYCSRSVLSHANPYRKAYHETIEKIIAARNSDGRPALRAGGFKMIQI